MHAVRTSTFAALVGLLLSVSPGAASAQDDVASQVEAICCGTDCCLIDTVCRSRGEANPDDSCEECDPSTSLIAWTNTCGAPDAGGPPPDDGGDGGGCAVVGARAGDTSIAGLLGLAALGLFLRRRRA